MGHEILHLNSGFFPYLIYACEGATIQVAGNACVTMEFIYYNIILLLVDVTLCWCGD